MAVGLSYKIVAEWPVTQFDAQGQSIKKKEAYYGL